VRICIAKDAAASFIPVPPGQITLRSAYSARVSSSQAPTRYAHRSPTGIRLRLQPDYGPEKAQWVGDQLRSDPGVSPNLGELIEMIGAHAAVAISVCAVYESHCRPIGRSASRCRSRAATSASSAAHCASIVR
jgi:hypothetical protein